MGSLCDRPIELVNPKSQIFYADVINDQAINQKQNDFSEKIKLQILINNINSRSNYQVKVSNPIGNKNYLLNKYNQCSNVNNSMAKLDAPIILRYYFEKQQHLLIEVLKTEGGRTNKYDISTSL